MTEPAQPQRRFQFSIRLAILVVTLIAAILGVMQLFYDPPVRPITAAQANQINQGMTERQVKRILGSPHRKEVHGTTSQWAFDFVRATEPSDANMEIVFDASGRAAEIRVSGYLSYADGTGQIVVPISDGTPQK